MRKRSTASGWQDPTSPRRWPPAEELHTRSKVQGCDAKRSGAQKVNSGRLQSCKVNSGKVNSGKVNSGRVRLHSGKLDEGSRAS